MKIRTFVLILILVLPVLIVVGNCATMKNAISKKDVMEAFCHTWTNPGGHGTDKDIYKHDGTYEWYYSVDSTTPNYRGTFKIEKAWTDSEGNIWFIVWRSHGSKALSKI